MIDNNRYNPKILGRRSGLNRRVYDYRDYKGIERWVNEDRRKDTRERKFARFWTKGGAFVKLQNDSREDVGQLIDISKSGLALLYTPKEEGLPNYSELGIFLFGDNLFIDQIPFRTVSDIELANEIPFSTVTYRRNGVQFEELTPHQTAKLYYFLLNHTLGEA